MVAKPGAINNTGPCLFQNGLSARLNQAQIFPNISLCCIGLSIVITIIKVRQKVIICFLGFHILVLLVSCLIRCYSILFVLIINCLLMMFSPSRFTSHLLMEDQVQPTSHSVQHYRYAKLIIEEKMFVLRYNRPHFMYSKFIVP